VGLDHIAPKLFEWSGIRTNNEHYPHPNPIILSPIRGGAIIGVFMIQALKRAFMGYRPFIDCP
jgi:hypothetical protein